MSAPIVIDHKTQGVTANKLSNEAMTNPDHRPLNQFLQGTDSLLGSVVGFRVVNTQVVPGIAIERDSGNLNDPVLVKLVIKADIGAI